MEIREGGTRGRGKEEAGLKRGGGGGEERKGQRGSKMRPIQ